MTGPNNSANGNAQAQSLAIEAAELLGELTASREWPTSETAEDLLSHENVVHALSLYLRAMTLAPEDPEYPWNAGSTAWRMGQAAVGLGLMARAAVLVERRELNEYWDAAGMWLAVAQAAASAEVEGLAATAALLAVTSDRGQLDETLAAVAADLTGALANLVEAASSKGRWLLQGGADAEPEMPAYGVPHSGQKPSGGLAKDVRRIVEPEKNWWVVRKEGGARSIGRFQSREEAEQRARQIVANKGGGTVLVKTRTNDVQVSKVARREF